jgi:hypothetical protein
MSVLRRKTGVKTRAEARAARTNRKSAFASSHTLDPGEVAVEELQGRDAERFRGP